MTAQILGLRLEWQPTVPNPWADELHPWWDHETHATGCGTHMSTFCGVRATGDPADTDGDPPVVEVAAWMGENGEQGVQVHIGRAGGEAWATLTVEEWRRLVAFGEKALALIATDPQMAPLPARVTA